MPKKSFNTLWVLGRSFGLQPAGFGRLPVKDPCARDDLYLQQQGLETRTPAGKARFGMMGVFAEFAGSMIAERVGAGLRRAKDSGVRLGRLLCPPRCRRPSETLSRGG